MAVIAMPACSVERVRKKAKPVIMASIRSLISRNICTAHNTKYATTPTMEHIDETAAAIVSKVIGVHCEVSLTPGPHATKGR